MDKGDKLIFSKSMKSVFSSPEMSEGNDFVGPPEDAVRVMSVRDIIARIAAVPGPLEHVGNFPSLTTDQTSDALSSDVSPEELEQMWVNARIEFPTLPETASLEEKVRNIHWRLRSVTYQLWQRANRDQEVK